MEHMDTPTPTNMLAVGLMSGTSLDGLDVVLVSFQLPGTSSSPSPTFRIVNFESRKYPPTLQNQLERAHLLSLEQFFVLDRAWAEFAAEVVKQVCGKHLDDVAVIASHGHTVLHSPPTYTVQLGSGAVLHARLERPVVCDFRSLDVALGGQGAPLVPVADAHLFAQYGATLNLGGFANVRDAATGASWDIAPCNTLLNRLAQREGLDYDDRGALAKQGVINQSLLDALQAIPHHKAPPSRKSSLSREWAEQHVWQLFDNAAASSTTRDLLATSVAYIADVVSRDCPPNTTVLVTGGGAYNDFLLSRMSEHGRARSVEFVVPEDNAVVEGKEAVCFAYLGVLRMRGEPNADIKATGASRASIGGALWGV